MSKNIIGTVLLNQFRVDAFVASGGMGAVYRVWDLKRNVSLAMKVLHSELADDPHIFKRFKREANALKKLTHPHIVQFFGLSQTGDLAFLLERYIDGPSLKDILRQKKQLPVEEALIYLKALCAALGYAHANGVVHCDVKPGNVLLDQGGNIYLTDFGIARHAESTTTTMAGAGTAAYMAPEQILGESVTPATDVYALGVMLYEMLTGQRPFRGTETGTERGGDTANERIRFAHLHLQPSNPRNFNSNISEELAQAILKAVAKEPAARFGSMQEFFEAIHNAAGVQFDQITERVNLPQVFQRTTSPAAREPEQRQWQPVPPATSRKIVPWLFGGTAFALIAITLIFSMNNPLGLGLLSPEETETTQPTFTQTVTATRTRRPTSTPSVRSSPTEDNSSKQYAQISREVAEVNLRRSPGYLQKNDAIDVVTKIPTGATVEIIGGPTEKDQVTWWNVSWNGYEGWIADHTGSGRTILMFEE